MAQTPVTYAQSEAVIDVPADTIATVTGSTDYLSLSADDTVQVEGDDNTVVGLPDSVVAVDGTGTFVASDGAVYVGAGGDALVSSAAPIAVVEHGDVGTNVVVPTGVQSVQVYSYVPSAANGNLDDETIAYSSSDGTGAFLSDTHDYADNLSTVDRVASGAFGNYDTFSIYSGQQGQGTLFQSIYNIVSQSGSTYTDSSIVHTFQAGFAASTGIASSDFDWSQAYGTGSFTKGVFAYTDGTSAEVNPFNGAFGCYRTVSFYTGANQTGTLAATSFDFVTGTSQTSFTGTGAFGCYKTVLRTSGADATGTATTSILDFANNSSETITLSANGTQATDVFSTGPDGTGTVTSSSTVAASTVLSKFDAFTVNPGAPHAVSMGDFNASASSAVAAVTTASASAATAAAATATTLDIARAAAASTLAAAPSTVAPAAHTTLLAVAHA